MNELKKELESWSKELSAFHLPKWEELPELDLYMDQVLTLIDRYLSPVIQPEKHTLLTSSMVNNYVKLGLIPAPEKKRYSKQHVAFLVAITLLKQVLTIPEIKEGILFQGKAVGIREAYNLFCEEQEQAIHIACRQAQGEAVSIAQQEVRFDYLAVKAATASFAAKLLAEKMIEIETTYMKEGHFDE